MNEEELSAEVDRLKEENARLTEENARLTAENEKLKQGSRSDVRLKVSEKGGLSIYGLGRFPVTLYKEQWEKLLGMADEIRAFIAENASRLKTKG